MFEIDIEQECSEEPSIIYIQDKIDYKRKMQWIVVNPKNFCAWQLAYQYAINKQSKERDFDITEVMISWNNSASWLSWTLNFSSKPID